MLTYKVDSSGLVYDLKVKKDKIKSALITYQNSTKKL